MAGRKRYKATDEGRKQVESMSACGIRHEDIALILGISADTLKKYYADELHTGRIKATHTIGRKLFEKAISGDTASIIFYLKTRAGWKETSVVEHQGGDNPVGVKFVDAPPQETREEWEARVKRRLARSD